MESTRREHLFLHLVDDGSADDEGKPRRQSNDKGTAGYPAPRRPSRSPGRRPPAHLWSSGISGLFLNSDEVLTHGFCSWFLPLPPPAEDFLGEDTVCALPWGARRVPPAAGFLAGREAALPLRSAGGTALEAWYFLLVACACCAVPQKERTTRDASAHEDRPRSEA